MEIAAKCRLMSRISRLYAWDMAGGVLEFTLGAVSARCDLTKSRAKRILCAMNFRAVRISLIITIIPRMVG
ncbi:hypothetical protein ACFZAI_27420 [Achromobacter sp. NPDC008082]|uniref:hypothetical protein n=1 Tax=Achromobacter sp. NPDC008082 TaxID=3363888 RepID=UPI0036ECC4FB